MRMLSVGQFVMLYRSPVSDAKKKKTLRVWLWCCFSGTVEKDWSWNRVTGAMLSSSGSYPAP
jgi:hypothetical protein